MLHWLAGQKSHETSTANHADPDTTGYIEPPETPAPVFAVRAFKHAIFGTPATQHRAPRRHSNTDNTRPRQSTRPPMTRPKSTSDAAPWGKNEDAIAPEPLPSPTKGILMTPGTAGRKQKTVSFGLQVVDNEEKRPLTSGLPDDCPGKFPSPWAKSEVEHVEESTDRSRSRSKLTEALEQARNESTKRRVKLGSKDKPKGEDDLTQDYAEPKSDSGRYWKNQYDLYREKSIRECKKLVMKQKLAKNYAQAADNRCTDLETQLESERERFEILRKRASELETQLKEYKEKLDEERGAKEELQRLKNGFKASSYRRFDGVASSTQTEKPEPERKSWRPTSSHAPSVLAPATNVALADPQKSKPDEGAAAKPRARPRNVHTKADDLWAPSSNLEPHNLDPSPPSPCFSRAVTSGTNATPLESLSINANNVQKEGINLAMSMGLQPPSPQRESRPDSPRRQSPIAKPSPEPKKAIPVAVNESIIVPQSSPFDPDAGLQQTPVSPIELRSARKSGRSKENVSPTRPKSRDENQKPSAAWTAMGAPLQEKRDRIVSKDGKEFGMSALERARARQAAKGRDAS